MHTVELVLEDYIVFNFWTFVAVLYSSFHNFALKFCKLQGKTGQNVTESDVNFLKFKFVCEALLRYSIGNNFDLSSSEFITASS